MKLSTGPDGRWHAAGAGGVAAMIRERFPAAADLLHTPDRRQFMRLMAASLALSGLAGCDDDDTHDDIVPPVTQAVGSAPGRTLTYASSTLLDGFANGVLVKTRDGRPIKIEGNPQHPWSRGGTDVFGQASVLGLYDPFRSQTVQHQTRDSSWDEFRAGMIGEHARLRAQRGERFALLLGPTTSPSLIAQLAALQSAWPGMRVFTHTPVTRATLYQATQNAFGRPLETHWRLDQARALVCLDGDLLDAGPHQVGAARGWSNGRRAMAGTGALLTMHAAAAVPNLTSAKADHAFSARPGLIAAMANALLARATGGSAPDLPADAAAWCAGAFHALDTARGAAVVQAGVHADLSVQTIAQRLNAVLGNTGRTVLHTQRLQAPGEDLQALVTAMQRGDIDTLLMIGANPIYDAPSSLGLAEALSRVRLKIHANLYADETATYADWHLPLAHPLESWSDARALDGTASLIQPTIAPLYGGRTAAELLSLMSDLAPLSSLDLLRAHWVRGDQDEPRWHQALLTGVVLDAAAPLETIQLSAAEPVAHVEPAATMDVVFRPDPTVWDGSAADNAWLQELPKPLTKLVWENAVQIGPVLARRAGLSNGDVVEITAGTQRVSGPVWIARGQADNVVCLSLGYGKRAAGQLSAGLGYDAAPLRPADGTWRVANATLRRTGATQTMASTQDHARMDGDGFVRTQRIGAAPVGDGDAPQPTLYAPQDSDGRAWGMVIDLDSCIGCNACVTACQSENNIAVVGRAEVLNGREMHWLRVDAYPASLENAADLPVSFMPVPCMQCEQAPCEVGCPVEATLHDHEGLNLMVYNRCIGTRACSGYCPYKVRRFNYADYSAGAAPSIVDQRNPDVTVRARGVMEKCTYCVQRIAEARVVSDRDTAPIADGTVQTACQGACPTQAIVFGDLAQPDSAVSRARRDPRRYALLGELNTRPRTTYLARWAI
jgi:molybdopterin-containing oxidoreductase family iron-sulfur binding subunit